MTVTFQKFPTGIITLSSAITFSSIVKLKQHHLGVIARGYLYTQQQIEGKERWKLKDKKKAEGREKKIEGEKERDGEWKGRD